METILEKYLRYRKVGRTGDCFLVESTKPVGKLISKCDNNAKWTHSFSCKWGEWGGVDRLQLLESSFMGADTGFLSKHIQGYTDFIVLRPKRTEEEIKAGINFVVNEAEVGIHYAYKLGMVELFNRKFGASFKVTDTGELCSGLIHLLLQKTNIFDYDNKGVIFPEDLFRYLNPDNIEIVKF